MDVGVGSLHLAVCRRFGSAVRSAEGRWDHQSPCPDWHARDIVEHVIGFHDVLLLRPLGLKPERPRGEPLARWDLTHSQLQQAFQHSKLPTLEAYHLIPRLTQDVLVHTWDLARAVGSDDSLDPAWCTFFLERLPADREALTASGMFAAPVVVDDQTDPQSRLLAALGRNPLWTPTN
ncbi:MAG: maleylpyruvate isomerase family mycothiol-dependent enzyme [Mycobacterium sp.]|uniref:maleylpyruvate isomerase family mycothiol-dependent enzyme n=1 Tax=Mycobacterium sp. TaxID=1785 RepID=UPI001EC8AE0F|nr:maleylpyruvate isomerase family mycothiol-dependent enzyme [Mycobacterium sp.]MBW0016182.1 maleylpyruvate isomerase family mycothiol-dependent enzyme [Mycobacterium sp.]